jgi:hypothetical protein
VVFREKMKLATPGDASGPSFFSVLRSGWRRIFPGSRAPGHQDSASLGQDFAKLDCSPELHGLIDALRLIRRRILSNAFLSNSTVWSGWILIGLIAAGALSATLLGWVIVAAILAATGVVAILFWTVRTRLSIYETACHLDAVARLQDRVSTAIYLGDIKNPDGIVLRQRVDAVSRLAKVDPKGLFPLRMPASARHALLLALIFGGLFVYRIHHKPPLIALLQTTARSSLVQSIFSPLVHAMERDLQRTMALVGLKPEPQADEVRAGEAMPTPEDLWPSGDDKGAAKAEAQQNPGDANNNDAQDEMQEQGDQNGLPSADSQQQEAGTEPQEGKDGSNNEGNSPTAADAQGSQSEKQSLSQSLMQALKNMMQNQKSNNRGSQKPQSPDQSGAQSGDSHQPGTTESDQQSRGNSDSKEKSQTSSNGAGSQPGAKELRKVPEETRAGSAVPDRVALEASGFKEQTRMRVETETGTAKLGVRDGSSQAAAVINGAEQENIPARYRLYVQHYFEHADTGTQ